MQRRARLLPLRHSRPRLSPPMAGFAPANSPVLTAGQNCDRTASCANASRWTVTMPAAGVLPVCWRYHRTSTGPQRLHADCPEAVASGVGECYATARRSGRAVATARAALFWELAAADPAPEGGGTGSAEDQIAQAVTGSVAVPAARAGRTRHGGLGSCAKRAFGAVVIVKDAVRHDAPNRPDIRALITSSVSIPTVMGRHRQDGVRGPHTYTEPAVPRTPAAAADRASARITQAQDATSVAFPRKRFVQISQAVSAETCTHAADRMRIERSGEAAAVVSRLGSLLTFFLAR